GAGALSGGTVVERNSRFDGAVSKDGSRIFWTTAQLVTGEGRVLVRENPRAPQSAFLHGGAFGHGNLVAGSNQITGVTTESGSLAIGQSVVSRHRLPAGTTITAVGAGTLTLSANALEGFSGVEIESYSECTEPTLACTVPVSESVTTKDSEF